MTATLPARALFAPASAAKELNVLGDRVWKRVSAAATGRQLAILEQVTRPGSGVPMHVHTHEDEVFHVLEGRVRFRTGGPEPTAVEAGPGDMIWLPRGLPHEFVVVGDQPARKLIYLLPGRMEGMLDEVAGLPPGPPDMMKIVQICSRYGVTFLSAEEEESAEQ